MRRTAIASVAVIALLAVGAAAASTASAKGLVLSAAGAPLAPGDSFEIYGRGNLAVTTSSGFLDCEDAFTATGLDVSVLKNSHATDELQIGYLFGGVLEPCRSFTGNAYVDLESIGSPLKIRANGKASSGAVGLLIDFEHIEYHGVRYETIECFFAHKHLDGTNEATPAPEKLQIELVGELALDASHSSVNAKRLCPMAAEMSLFLPTTENEVGEAIEEQAT